RTHLCDSMKVFRPGIRKSIQCNAANGEFQLDRNLRPGSYYVAAVDSRTDSVRVKPMTPSLQSPRIHDLLLTTSTEIRQACQAEPAWVRPALAKYPWVVARRAIAPEDRIAVGVRGQERQQRWGGFMR